MRVIKLVLEIDGEKVVLETENFKITRAKKPSCDARVEDYVSKLSDKRFVDATLANQKLPEVNPTTVGHGLKVLGYVSSFKRKIDGVHHYIRYDDLVISESEIKALL